MPPDGPGVVDVSDGAAPIDGEASVDGSGPGGATCAWTGMPSFVDITALADLDTPESQTDPHLSPDGQTLYFTDTRFGSSDVLASRRLGITSFEAPVQVPGLSEPDSGESGFAFTDSSLLRIVISAGGDAAIMTGGNNDLFTAERASTSTAFGDLTPLSVLNTVEHEFDPAIHPVSGDLFFASFRAGGPAPLNLYRAPREGAGWGTPQMVSDLVASGNTAALVFTPDGRYGLFQGPDGNIHFTEHLGGSSFTPSVPVPDLSTGSFEGEPFITADGCEVFFVRDGSNDWDIFRARVVP